MGLEAVHIMIVMELMKEIIKPLSIIYHQSWLTREDREDWRLADVIPSYRKGWKWDLKNYWPESLTSLTRKVMNRLSLV